MLAVVLVYVIALIVDHGLVSGQPRVVMPTPALSGLPAGGDIDGLSPAEEVGVSRGLGATLPSYWARRTDGVLTARSTPSGLSERFLPGRVDISTRLGDVSLRLTGAPSGSPSVSTATPQADRNLITYRHDGIVEYYANGPGGLEQSLKVGRADARPQLRFTFAVGGSLRAVPAAIGVVFVDRAGAIVLRDEDLRVTDARGRVLPASMVTQSGRLAIVVDAKGARYPISVDPILTPSTNDGMTSSFGTSVSASNTTIAVGAPNAGSGNGAVYMFSVNSISGAVGGAIHQAQVLAAAASPDGGLGTSVAVSGSSIAATAPNAAATYVFVPNITTTTYNGVELKMGSQSFAPPDWSLGFSADGATIAVGVPYQSGGGIIVVFTKGADGTWSTTGPTTTLNDGGRYTTDELARSVAVEGSTIAAGDPYGNAGTRTDHAGAVVLFQEQGNSWAIPPATETLGASGAAAGAGLGTSIALAGANHNIVVAGAPDDTVNGDTYAGSVYVFTGQNGFSSYSTAQLTSASPAAYDQFGQDVAASVTGAQIYAADIGAPNPSGTGSTAGLWSFEESTSGWGSSAEPSSLTYAGDSAYGDSQLLTIAGGSADGGAGSTQPAEILGEPGNGDVNVVCSASGCPTGTDETTAAVSCSPALLATATASSCTATVTDAAPSGGSVPGGMVSFTASPQSGSFTGSSCALSPAGTGSTGSCSVTFTPSSAGSQTITGSYGGDGSHAPSTGTAAITAQSTMGDPAVGHVSVSGTTATVPVSCSGQASCDVKVTVSVVETQQGGKTTGVTARASDSKKKKKKAKRTVVLASKKATIPAGHHTKVKVRLDGTGKRLLSRYHTLRARLTVVQHSKTIKSSVLTFKARH